MAEYKVVEEDGDEIVAVRSEKMRTKMKEWSWDNTKSKAIRN